MVDLTIWSKNKIIREVACLYIKGEIITGGNISKLNPKLHSAIYYKQESGGERSKEGKYFSSLAELRIAVASHFKRSGNLKAAKNILKLNEPRKSSKKFSKKDIRRKKKELVEILEKKIEDGEDVSYRVQQNDKKTRPFVHSCTYIFGQYKKVFKEAGISYETHTHYNLPKTKRENLKVFVAYIKRGAELSRDEMFQRDPKLVEFLNRRFKGYHNALSKAKESLKRKGNKKQVERIEQYYRDKESNKEKRISKKQEEIKKSLSEVFFLDRDLNYFPEDFPFFEIKEEMKGKELIKLFENSEDWMNSTELATSLRCCYNNVTRNIMFKFPEESIKVKRGKSVTYFFNSSIIDNYERSNPYKISLFPGLLDELISEISQSDSEKEYMELKFKPKIERFFKINQESSKEDLREYFFDLLDRRELENYVENYLKKNSSLDYEGLKGIIEEPFSKFVEKHRKGEIKNVFGSLEILINSFT